MGSTIEEGPDAIHGWAARAQASQGVHSRVADLVPDLSREDKTLPSPSTASVASHLTDQIRIQIASTLPRRVPPSFMLTKRLETFSEDIDYQTSPPAPSKLGRDNS